MLGYSRRDKGNAKKKKITKQIKFHQVKVTSPFLLNKITVTSTTKQPRKARCTSTTKQSRNARFTTNCRTAEAGLQQS